MLVGDGGPLVAQICQVQVPNEVHLYMHPPRSPVRDIQRTNVQASLLDPLLMFTVTRMIHQDVTF